MDQDEMSKELEQVQVKKEEYPFKVLLKDFGGAVVFEMNLKEPLQFPYLFWQKRLFVTSRDEPGSLLERSYHVFMGQAKSNERH